MNRERIERLIDLARTIDPEHFDLASYYYQIDDDAPFNLHDCGSTACLLGYAGHDPWFMGQGYNTLMSSASEFFSIPKSLIQLIFNLHSSREDTLIFYNMNAHPVSIPEELKKITAVQVADKLQDFLDGKLDNFT